MSPHKNPIINQNQQVKIQQTQIKKKINSKNYPNFLGWYLTKINIIRDINMIDNEIM